MKDTIHQANTIAELEKLILCKILTNGDVRHHKAQVAKFFENGDHAKEDIEKTILSWVGGEKWIAYNKERESVSGNNIYSTDVYNSVAMIFDHYTRQGKIFQGISRTESLVTFVEELSLQLKEYRYKYYRSRRLDQFEEILLWKLYVSILKNGCQTNLAKLKICITICELSSDGNIEEHSSYALLVNTISESFPTIITKEQRQKMLNNIEVRWNFFEKIQ